MSGCLKKPCHNCPFKADRNFHLGRERAQEIVDGLLSEQEFHCHNTVDYSELSDGEITADSKICAGAFALNWKAGRLTIQQRLHLLARHTSGPELEKLYPLLHESFERFVFVNTIPKLPQ